MEPKKKEYKTYDAYSFYTYSQISSVKFNFILWMLLSVPGIAFLILYFLSDDFGAWSLYAGIICFGVFFIRWFIDLAQRIFTFNTYVNFPTYLGFKLEGWDSLGSYPKQLVKREWSKNSTLEISVNADAKDVQLKLINDALYLFVSRANEHFYEAEAGGDGRTQWKISKTLKVNGSSDVYVIGEMYTLINVYLKSIQEKHPVIVTVKIKFDPNIFTVSPPYNVD